MVGVTVAPWPSVDHSTCQHCGAHVTDRFRRVLGDEDRAHRCGDDDVPEFVQAARQVLERDDLTLKQRREIAKTLSTRAMTFEVESEIAFDAE
ncbi:DUF7563 family protein [Natrinema sp. CGMCC1.2065]|uniref:DUF7563 family protein n=1 Tax=Natrinema sp. CGMCC1.2065 TaxID=3445767 RepID=UPI003F4A2304